MERNIPKPEIKQPTFEEMDKTLTDIMASGDSKIDPYMQHTIRIEFEREGQELTTKSELASTIHFSFLLRTIHEEWRHGHIPGFNHLGNLGNIHIGTGNLISVVHLQKDPEVLQVEGSMPGGPFDEE